MSKLEIVKTDNLATHPYWAGFGDDAVQVVEALYEYTDGDSDPLYVEAYKDGDFSVWFDGFEHYCSTLEEAKNLLDNYEL